MQLSFEILPRHRFPTKKQWSWHNLESGFIATTPQRIYII